LALGTIVTIGTLGLNFEMLIAVRPVLEITMMHAADRFFEASDTDCKKGSLSVMGMIGMIYTLRSKWFLSNSVSQNISKKDDARAVVSVHR
jgi:hypothetical protein